MKSTRTKTASAERRTRGIQFPEGPCGGSLVRDAEAALCAASKIEPAYLAMAESRLREYDQRFP